MNEREKLAEAEWFLVRLRNTKFDESGRFDRTAFEYLLSAFLSASRAVLQRAHKEAITKTGGQHRNDAPIEQRPVVEFLRGERNRSIHEAQIVPKAHATIQAPGTIVGTAEGGLRLLDDDGNVLQEVRPQPGGGSVSLEGKPDVITHYSFAGWDGPEDVVTLGRQYLNELVVILADGQNRGFLSPDAPGDDRKANQPDSALVQVQMRREAPGHEGPER